jgi:predicted nucleotidyltransferase
VTTAQQIVARRRRERVRLLAQADAYVDGLDGACDIRAVVVFGSVARGDFNDGSDVDVLVVAGRLPARAPDRLHALGPIPPAVEVVAWTPGEWRAERARGNPIATEAVTDGVWLVGGRDHDLSSERGDEIVPAKAPASQGGRPRDLIVPVAEFVLGMVDPSRQQVTLRFRHQLQHWRTERVRRFTDGLNEGGDLDEGVTARLLADEARMDLLRAGVEAALDTHLHAKAEAIGRSVRTGVLAADTARVDEARLVVRALAVLEAAHVRVVLELQRHEAAALDEEAQGGVRRRDGDQPGRASVAAQRLAEAWPGGADVLPALTAVLAAQGLIERPQTLDGTFSTEDPGGRWRLTPHGRRLLDTWSEHPQRRT